MDDLLKNLTDETAKALAERLAPFIGATLAATPGVTIKRMHRVTSGMTVAYVDLTFTVGTAEICTVHGFKLLRNPTDESMWLGLPQRKAERDGETKWLDTFEFCNANLEKLARRIVVDEFKRLEKEEQKAF